MTRTKPLREALLALNFSKIDHELGKQVITAETVEEVLKLTRQLGVLAVIFPDHRRELQRDAFITAFRAWLGTNDFISLIEVLDKIEQQARLCESAFHLILQGLENSPFGRAKLDVALWGVLAGVAQDIEVVASAVSNTEAEKIDRDTVYLSAESLRIDALGREGLDPDSIAERYATNLAGYLKMNGHKHGRFENGVLILPRPTLLPDTVVGDRSPVYFAEIWNQLESHWAKVRYFATSDVALDNPLEPGASSTLAFFHDHKFFLDVEIARSRLRRHIFEIMMHVVYSSKIHPLIGDPRAEHLPLAPHRFLSTSEAVAMMVLDVCYELRLRSEKKPYLGLTLSQWLRGYALLQWCSETGAGLVSHAEGLSKIDRREFARLAAQADLPAAASENFLNHAIFGARSRDLWDTPLLRDEDGELYLITSLVKTINIAEALVSRLNSLLQQIKSKGPKFESEIRQQYELLGATTKQFKYPVGDSIYECDVAALWSGVLLLNECKAYVLPQPSAEDLYFFQNKQQEAVEQITRIAKHFADDPTILEKYFPEAARVKETVLCVVNQTPFWTEGFGQGVRFFDGAALSKFVSGSIDAVVRSPLTETDVPILEEQLHSLWAGALPTPGDLKLQMQRPFQYRAEARMWEVVVQEIRLTDSLSLRFPTLQRKPDPPFAS